MTIAVSSLYAATAVTARARHWARGWVTAFWPPVVLPFQISVIGESPALSPTCPSPCIASSVASRL
jgi:hypothetical protein